MSLVTVPTSESIFQSINLVHISSGIQGVFNEILPLLSPDSSLDPPVLEELRRCMTRFGQGAGYAFMGVMHTASATQTAALMLTTWNAESPSDRLSDMISVSEGLLLAEVNVADAQTGLSEVKGVLETLFTQFVARHGADLVIRIATKKEDGNLNVENVALQTLESRVIRNLQETESTIRAFHTWLKQLQEWLQSFLQDKDVSLTEKLEDNPFWSQHPIQKWQILRTQMNETYGQLLSIREGHPAWFADSEGDMEQDKAARQHTIQVPVPQVKTPAEPDPALAHRYTPIPFRALYEHIGTRSLARHCAVKLESIEPAGKGVSSIKLRFTADVDEQEPLHGINIRCQYTSLESTASPVLKQHHPRTALDLRNDDVKPPGCQTSLKVITSRQSNLEWRFSPFRFWRRNTTRELPLNFPFSLDLEHSSDISLNIEVTVYRCDWLILKRLQNRHSAIITVRAPAHPIEESEGTADLELIKPVNAIP